MDNKESLPNAGSHVGSDVGSNAGPCCGNRSGIKGHSQKQLETTSKSPSQSPSQAPSQSTSKSTSQPPHQPPTIEEEIFQSIVDNGNNHIPNISMTGHLTVNCIVCGDLHAYKVNNSMGFPRDPYREVLDTVSCRICHGGFCIQCLEVLKDTSRSHTLRTNLNDMEQYIWCPEEKAKECHKRWVYNCSLGLKSYGVDERAYKDVGNAKVFLDITNSLRKRFVTQLIRSGRFVSYISTRRYMENIRIVKVIYDNGEFYIHRDISKYKGQLKLKPLITYKEYKYLNTMG